MRSNEYWGSTKILEEGRRGGRGRDGMSPGVIQIGYEDRWEGLSSQCRFWTVTEGSRISYFSQGTDSPGKWEVEDGSTVGEEGGADMGVGEWNPYTKISGTYVEKRRHHHNG